jgi:hypothetical protein
VTKSACEHTGFAAVGDDVRQRAVVAGVPNRRNETITQLGPGVAGRAVWHANWLSIIDGRLVVGIVKRIGPSGRNIGGGCHSYREQATNDHRREQRGNNPHFRQLSGGGHGRVISGFGAICPLPAPDRCRHVGLWGGQTERCVSYVTLRRFVQKSWTRCVGQGNEHRPSVIAEPTGRVPDYSWVPGLKRVSRK